jgi:hypothetical protein
MPQPDFLKTEAVTDAEDRDQTDAKASVPRIDAIGGQDRTDQFAKWDSRCDEIDDL